MTDAELDAWLDSLGFKGTPRFIVKRGPPTPADERRGNVIAGVRSMEEALEKVDKAFKEGLGKPHF